MIGATAILKVKTLVPERRKIIKYIREEVCSFLAKNNFDFVPSVSNCFMLNIKRPAKPFVKAMQKEKIYVGRVWPRTAAAAMMSVVKPTQVTPNDLSEEQTNAPH